MSTKEIVQAIADSIVAEVDGADEWTVTQHLPIWKNPKKGKQLAIYESDSFPEAEGRTNKYRFDSVTINVEYTQPAPQQARGLNRDEEAEQEIKDVSDSLIQWAADHQLLPGVAVALDFQRLRPAAAMRQELFVRGFQIALAVRRQVVYG